VKDATPMTPLSGTLPNVHNIFETDVKLIFKKGVIWVSFGHELFMISQVVMEIVWFCAH